MIAEIAVNYISYCRFVRQTEGVAPMAMAVCAFLVWPECICGVATALRLCCIALFFSCFFFTSPLMVLCCSDACKLSATVQVMRMMNRMHCASITRKSRYFLAICTHDFRFLRAFCFVNYECLAGGIGIAVERNWKLFISIDLPLFYFYLKRGGFGLVLSGVSIIRFFLEWKKNRLKFLRNINRRCIGSY